MLQDFHFLQPLWLLALLPLALLLQVLSRPGGGSAWRRVMDPPLLAALRVERGRPRSVLLVLALGWLLAVLALANPTVERRPVPAFRPDAARVVVLDLSRSMLAADLTPSRLERARYKVADVLERSADGQVGLVVFAGDAFTVSPLTDDAETIRALLEALSPQLMPVQGSRADLGIERALDLLRQAGAGRGEVLLLTDAAGDERALAAARAVRRAGHRLSVLGVGTAAGARVPGVSTSEGAVTARLDAAALQALAERGGGRFATLSSGSADLARVLREPGAGAARGSDRDPLQTEAWYALGPWLALALLPLAALAFRRGWLAVALILVGPGLATAPRPALALDWADLWQRPDQQAAAAFEAGEHERARALARSPARAGSAAYRLGDYEAAAERFAAGHGASDHYNRGNALARAGRLEEALAAYDAALAHDPGLEDARYNRDQVEAALQREQAQPNQQDRQGQQGQRGRHGAPRGGEAARDGAAPRAPAAAGQSGTGEAGEREGAQAEGRGRAGGAGQALDAGENAAAGAESEPSAGGAKAAGEGSAAGGPRSSPEARRERLEQVLAEYGDAAQAAADGRGAGRAPGSPEGPTPGGAAATDEAREAQQAAERWLRRIPDDPAELLRRKFLYQYRQRAGEAEAMAAGAPW